MGREERGRKAEGGRRSESLAQSPVLLTPHASRLTPSVRRAIGCGFGGAMVAAPFLALLFDVTAGLAVMAVGLGATAYLAAEAAGRAEPEVRRRLRAFAAVNGVLAVACVVVFVARVV